MNCEASVLLRLKRDVFWETSQLIYFLKIQTDALEIQTASLAIHIIPTHVTDSGRPIQSEFWKVNELRGFSFSMLKRDVCWETSQFTYFLKIQTDTLEIQTASLAIHLIPTDMTDSGS